jgi:hypothetical protein
LPKKQVIQSSELQALAFFPARRSEGLPAMFVIPSPTSSGYLRVQSERLNSFLRMNAPSLRGRNDEFLSDYPLGFHPAWARTPCLATPNGLTWLVALSTSLIRLDDASSESLPPVYLAAPLSESLNG